MQQQPADDGSNKRLTFTNSLRPADYVKLVTHKNSQCWRKR